MNSSTIQLSDHFNYRRLLHFTLPAILMLIFTSIYSVVDGFFVSNFTDKTPFAAGITNIILDALLVAVFHFGLIGAAAATALSQFVGGVIPLIYFGHENNSPLRLGKCRFDGQSLLRSCTNGSSELMSNISMSAVSMLFNIQLMKYAGENGIAAYGVLMYVSMIFQAIFIGYSVGAAPVISYHYGAQTHGELKSLRQKSLVLISAFSALISFLRTLVFQCASVLTLPLFLGLDGIWLSMVIAEVMASIVTALFLIGKQKKYHY